MHEPSVRHPSRPLRWHAPPPWACIVMVCGLLLVACTPRVILVDRGPQAYYQTGFPVHDTSRALEQAFRSLRRVTYTAAYETYIFTREAGVTEGALADPAVLDRAAQRFTDIDSKSGTAVIFSRAGRLVLLVTNDHVVRFAPVRVHYFDEDRARQPRASRRVASVSVRTGEWGALFGHPELGTFEVVARDSVSDVAAIEVRLPEGTAAESFPPLSTSPGDPRRLSWGSFVYVLGYPSGYPMVTRAVVSDPNRDRRGEFLTDGLWNEGISGGAILAVRGDDGRLDWVGMTRASAGRRDVELRPRDEAPLEEDIGVLYDGPIYLEPALKIQYGITLSVPMTALRGFIEENRAMLHRRGYDLRGF